MKKRGKKEPIQRIEQIRRQKSESFISLYANDLQIESSPWDFRFLIGLITKAPSEEDKALTITTIAELRLSPQLAKRMFEVLGVQLQGYESSVGPIPGLRNS